MSKTREGFPEFTPVSAVTVPESTYDKMWMTKMVVRSQDPNKPTTIVVEFVPCKTVGDTTVLQPNGETKRLDLPDVFGLAEANPQFAQVMGGVLLTMKQFGVAAGLFQAEDESSESSEDSE